MIAGDPPLGNLWRSSAAVWFVSFGSLLAFSLPIASEFGTGHGLSVFLAWLWLGGAILLWLVGTFHRISPVRVRTRVMIAATFAYVPILSLVTIVSCSYFVFIEHGGSIDIFLRIAVATCLLLWCALQIRDYRRRIDDRHFMEREYTVETDRIVMHTPLKTDLSAPPISDKTQLGRLYHKLGPYLFMLIPLAYPLQRLFADTGGTEAVLLLLTILALPLMFHTAGRLACGAYLHLYRVGQLERLHGKPVVIEVDDASIA